METATTMNRLANGDPSSFAARPLVIAFTG
jgi:hypothetical protein